ncbi:hypothetical protein [Comamonas sp. 4034]|uniref:hypothetical protein n=1 Tax=Comamonas sp. 4034 TaxID=3156455 RepID=UPI003D24C7E0
MSLWNPYALTPDGRRTTSMAPPALRVMGGRATVEQLAMAQAEFARFCGRSRVSFWRNPNEQGVLKDGSRYQIITIGNSTVMTIWPVGAAEQGLAMGGVSFFASFEGGALYQYVLAYRNEAWVIRRAPIVYGGSGVWASSTKNVYFTDDTASGGATPNLNRKYSEENLPSLIVAGGATSVEKGMAYGIQSGGSANVANVVSPSGKYVQVVQTDALTAQIYEADLVKRKVFEETPDEFYTVPAAKQTVIASNPDFNLTRSHLYGVAAFSRLRDGSAVYFPAWSVSAIGNVIGPTDTGEGWLDFVTHELKVTLSPNGEYSAAVVPHALPELTLLEPPKAPNEFGDLVEQTHFEFSKHGWADSGLTPLKSTSYIEYFDPGAGQNVRTFHQTDIGWKDVRGRAETVERVRKKKNYRVPVYLARGWQDQKIAFFARVEDEKNAVVESSVNEDFDHGLVQAVFGAPLWKVNGRTANDTLSYIDLDDITPDFSGGLDNFIDFNAYFEANPAPDLQFDFTMLGEKYIAKRAATLRGKTTLETPWGELVTNDVDLVVRMQQNYARGRYSGSGLEEKEVLYTGISGRHVRREIVHINPILGIIACLEITTSQYTVNNSGEFTTVSTVGTTAKLVVLLKNKKIFEIECTPTESSYTRRKDDTLVGVFSFSPFTPADRNHSLLRGKIGALWNLRNNTHVPAVAGVIIPSGIGDVEITKDSEIDRVKDIYPVAKVEGQQWMKTAIDPNSGGGALLVPNEAGQVVYAQAISPAGVLTPLDALVPQSAGALQPFSSHLISV